MPSSLVAIGQPLPPSSPLLFPSPSLSPLLIKFAILCLPSSFSSVPSLPPSFPPPLSLSLPPPLSPFLPALLSVPYPSSLHFPSMCLRPLLSAPSERSHDAKLLFDQKLFLQHCPAAERSFFRHLFDTQLFCVFVEQCSFVHAESTALAFFDECTEKVLHTATVVPLLNILLLLPLLPPSSLLLPLLLPLFSAALFLSLLPHLTLTVLSFPLPLPLPLPPSPSPPLPPSPSPPLSPSPSSLL